MILAWASPFNNQLITNLKGLPISSTATNIHVENSKNVKIEVETFKMVQIESKNKLFLLMKNCCI